MIKRLLVLLLVAILTACGGGGGDEGTETQCQAATVVDANRLITQQGPLACRVWTVGSQVVDGVAYPDFLIGED